jgi:hypothetical protein
VREPFIVKRHGGGFAVFARTSTAPLPNSGYGTRADAERHCDNVKLAQQHLSVAMAELVAGQVLSGSAIAALQASPPQLTTRANVEIVKTGIEYPLATGPQTFTPEDLLEAVAAQDDPAIVAPRPQPMSWAFVDKYVDEVYAVISEDYFYRSQRTPQGFDTDALDRMLAAL